MTRKVVFISYSHDSPAHRELVLALSERLREDGLETRLDQYVNGTPDSGWPRWMLDQIDEADFVLVVCTETYYRRFRGHEAPEKGKGVDWEGAIISLEIYNARSTTTKFVPVLLSEEEQPFIPEPLGSYTRYMPTSEAGYKALYDFLQGQAGVEPGVIGSPNVHPRRTGHALTFADGTSSDATEVVAKDRPAATNGAHKDQVALSLQTAGGPESLRERTLGDGSEGRSWSIKARSLRWAVPVLIVVVVCLVPFLRGKRMPIDRFKAELAKHYFDAHRKEFEKACLGTEMLVATVEALAAVADSGNARDKACVLADRLYPQYHSQGTTQCRPALDGFAGPERRSLNEWITSIEDMETEIPELAEVRGPKTAEWWIVFVGLVYALEDPAIAKFVTPSELKRLRGVLETGTVKPWDLIVFETFLKAKLDQNYKKSAPIAIGFLCANYSDWLNGKSLDREIAKKTFSELIAHACRSLGSDGKTESSDSHQ